MILCRSVDSLVAGEGLASLLVGRQADLNSLLEGRFVHMKAC